MSNSLAGLAELAEISGFASRARSLLCKPRIWRQTACLHERLGPGGIFGVTCFLGVQGHMGLLEGLLWRGPEAQRGMAGPCATSG